MPCFSAGALGSRFPLFFMKSPMSPEYSKLRLLTVVLGWGFMWVEVKCRPPRDIGEGGGEGEETSLRRGTTWKGLLLTAQRVE